MSGWRFCLTKTNLLFRFPCAVRRGRVLPRHSRFSTAFRAIFATSFRVCRIRSCLPGFGGGGGSGNSGSINVSSQAGRRPQIFAGGFDQPDARNRQKIFIERLSRQCFRLVFNRQQSRFGTRRFGRRFLYCRTGYSKTRRIFKSTRRKTQKRSDFPRCRPLARTRKSRKFAC